MARIFIASSTEGQNYAELAMSVLADHGESVLPWWSGKAFPVGQSLVDSLIKILDDVDAALIVATEDDKTIRRGQNFYSPAHNVILELGLFSGRLGMANVPILQVGAPTFPSDLDGLAVIRVRPVIDGEDRIVYRDTQMKPQLTAWLESIEAASSDGVRIARLVDSLAPGLGQSGRISLKASILRARLNINALPKQPPTTVEHLLLKYTHVHEMGMPAGYDYRSPLDAYVNLADVSPSSDDGRALSGHFARYVAELAASGRIEPTLIAISKTAAQGFLHATERLLPYPVVLVSPVGPSRKHPVEGFYETGDRAILLHDVALSGHHLVDCVVSLRSVGIECNDLIAFTRHQAGSRELNTLMRENSINVRTASAYIPDRGRVACGDLSLGESLEIPADCALCDVLADSDTAPIRGFLSRGELPTEALSTMNAFTAISDVAPLSPGHLLLVTKQHVLAMNRLSNKDLSDLDIFRRQAFTRLQDIYSLPVIGFEHGLCNRASTPNCGIDHAHLHVVPTDADLETTLRRDFAVTSLERLSDLYEATKGHKEYLLLINSEEDAMLAYPSSPASQYFRRLLAQSAGRELWNWNDEIILGSSSQRKQWILNLHRSWNKLPD